MLYIIALVTLSGPKWEVVFDPQCITKHGVTHCWEYIAKDWDPREPPSEWAREYYYKNALWGTYPTEKHE